MFTILVLAGSLHLVFVVGPVAGLLEVQLARQGRALDHAVAVQVNPPLLNKQCISLIFYATRAI